jgi:hypothetical protein
VLEASLLFFLDSKFFSSSMSMDSSVQPATVSVQDNRNTESQEGTIRLVLMVPLRRCGSHALRLRLNRNSKLYSPYPLHLIDLKPILPLYGDLNNDDNYLKLIKDVLGLLECSVVTWDDVSFDTELFFDRIRSKPRSVYTIAMEMLLEAGKQHKSSVVMDKSLDNIHDWEEILSIYPDIRFLNVVRDPRAQVSSMNKSIIYEFDSILNANIWKKAHEAVQKLIKIHPENVLTVTFEDFIENEKDVIEKISHFFGMDFFPEMLSVNLSEEAKRLASQSQLWESNTSSPIRSNIEKYKQTLTEDEIKQIETITGHLMDIYGYKRLYSETSRIKITDEIIAQAKLRSDQKRKEAWNELQISNIQDYQRRQIRISYIERCRQRLLNHDG